MDYLKELTIRYLGDDETQSFASKIQNGMIDKKDLEEIIKISDEFYKEKGIDVKEFAYILTSVLSDLRNVIDHASGEGLNKAIALYDMFESALSKGTDFEH